MKLKKKAKVIIILITIVILLITAGIIISKVKKDKTPEVKEVKVLKTIDDYGYNLKDNKNARYKELFKELETILLEEKVNDEEYVKKISEMFIYDFYSLSERSAKTDVGGVDFVYPSSLQNFLINAENTFYKYVESNIYGDRKQKLPLVETITIESIIPTEYVYGEKKYPSYEVKAKWTYTDSSYNSYQSNATLTFIKEDIKYYLVELQ